MRTALIAASLLIGLTMPALADRGVAGKTAAEAAQKAAGYKHLPPDKTACYAKISESYFQQGPDGRWAVATKSIASWTDELRAQCGIAR